MPDLVASLPLGLIVIFVMTLSISSFITTYSDIRDYTKMEDDLFQAIETLRCGYIETGVNTNKEPLCGLLSANQVRIGSNQDRITLGVQTASASTIQSIAWINNGELYISGQYGISTFRSPLDPNNPIIQLFPESTSKIGSEKKYQLINTGDFFTPLKVDSEGNVRLLGIKLEARVRFRERRNGQSASDDLLMNTRTIRYETKVFIGNVPRSGTA
ncbi:MAG: hypothetical protein P9X26_02985 [Candidatus Stygibacter frigidus]|nr:hypothetical protein [Candidatus Stygibacter frigidus]